MTKKILLGGALCQPLVPPAVSGKHGFEQEPHGSAKVAATPLVGCADKPNAPLQFAQPNDGYEQSAAETPLGGDSLTPLALEWGDYQLVRETSAGLSIRWHAPPDSESTLLAGYTVVRVPVSIAPSLLEQDITVIGAAEEFEVGPDMRRYAFTESRDPTENIEYRLAVYAQSNDHALRQNSLYSNLLYWRILSVSAFQQQRPKPVPIAYQRPILPILRRDGR